MKRLNTQELALAFYNALKIANEDPCYHLNIGVHDKIIRKAWDKLKKHIERKQR